MCGSRATRATPLCPEFWPGSRASFHTVYPSVGPLIPDIRTALSTFCNTDWKLTKAENEERTAHWHQVAAGIILNLDRDPAR